MKIRIASSIALAAALALGATGCSLMAPQGTLKAYAPSDGVDVTVEGIAVRNIMLIADESGENFNVVFTAYNPTGAEQNIGLSLTGDAGENASTDFDVPTGTTKFGDPSGAEKPVLVTMDGVEPGQTVDAFFQVAGAAEVEHRIPVLDGTLAEYRDFVVSASAADSDSASKDDDASE